MRIEPLIRLNFHFAVWATIVCGPLLVMAPGYSGERIGTSVRVPTGIIMCSALQLLNWFWWYRHGQGKAAAGALGLAFIVPIIAAIIRPQVTGESFNTLQAMVFGYLAVSHAAYALLGWRLRPRSALDL